MTRIIQSLAEIAGEYDTIFCDLWGAVHDGQRAFPSAVEALLAFRDGGARRVALLTNAPRPAVMIEAQLDRMGIPRAAWDVIVTSGDAAQDAMLRGVVGQRVWHLGPDKDDSFFTDLPPDLPDDSPRLPITRVPMDEAEGIVCTGLFDDMTEGPQDYLTVLTEAAARGLPMLCANPDIVVDFGDKRIYCAGALAELYQQLGGEAIYVGKPHPPIYQLAARSLRLDASARIVAAGDGITTDVLGAINEGLDALFISGGLAFDQFGPDPEAPLAQMLDEWLAGRGLAPTYSIGRLR
ncbi:HAD-IIA family hydrolase [Paracoccus suum]|uniref:HAD-IIA family hydrolase n=1 Tax=Paracoccus suum TaxID=2259340 RepID=A0A344PNH6_9RHOB|nr:HAD family hydrolase [Paracoccus suum]AXC50931.1 HAD-IIA family hydrolase [Paracoccus suum]